jgi:hypothetical protein
MKNEDWNYSNRVKQEKYVSTKLKIRPSVMLRTKTIIKGLIPFTKSENKSL